MEEPGADGTLAWTPEVPPGFDSAGGGPMSVMADLDGDGRQELVTGPAALTWDDDGIGRILWANEQVYLGAVAVGQLDADAHPEVVIAGRDSLPKLAIRPDSQASCGDSASKYSNVPPSFT